MNHPKHARKVCLECNIVYEINDLYAKGFDYKDNPLLALIPKDSRKGVSLPIAYRTECGAASIGVDAPSSWCPSHKEIV